MSSHTSPKFAILGAQGQLGKAFCQLLGSDAIPLTRKEGDLTKVEECIQYLKKIQPSAIFNAAAYTQVDQAETDTVLADQINSKAPTRISEWCQQNGIPFVHFSTDYVFSGTGENPWKETDSVSPVNAYGQTKLNGELGIQKLGGKFLIFRTSWVYDAQGKNFLTTMLRLGKERETLKIVNDQIGAPTYATHLAEGAFTAFLSASKMPNFPGGIYHLCNRGETSWFYFANAIFRQAREKGILLQIKEVQPIASSEYPVPAKRPKNSRLNMNKVLNTFNVSLPSWEDGLKTCMENLK